MSDRLHKRAHRTTEYVTIAIYVIECYMDMTSRNAVILPSRSCGIVQSVKVLVSAYTIVITVKVTILESSIMTPEYSSALAVLVTM